MRTINVSRSFSSQLSWEDAASAESLIHSTSRVHLVVDGNARWVVEPILGFDPTPDQCFVLEEPNEQKKTLETASRILDFLFSQRADRRSVLLAVGGGVTLDVAGFAASIFMRGIRWVAIPTTLLAQVDASVGGKTAVNHVTGKNAIGAFHPPTEVIMSAFPADSWEEYHYHEGIAEMYKIFRTFDRDSAQKLVENKATADLTRRSVEIKANVIDVDPWERNLRASLNYGHTVAHAIEHLTGLRHGIAVAVGILAENEVAVELGLMDQRRAAEIRTDITALGIPIPDAYPIIDEILPFIIQDKKNESGELLMSLIPGDRDLAIQRADPRTPVTQDIFMSAYTRFVSSF